MLSIYAPNIISRNDRKIHLQREFVQKEYVLNFVPPIVEEYGALSLWLTLQHIIKKKVDRNDDFFIFCEDDHQFTENYDFQLLKDCIQQAEQLNADILSGGVSWFKTGIQISKNLFWIEKFSGLQFTVIFKKFYQKILDVTDFGEHDAADYKISDLTDKKFIIYPFISIQKDFGYSDVTPKNNQEGRVEKLFEDTSGRFAMLKKVRNFYLPDFNIEYV